MTQQVLASLLRAVHQSHFDAARVITDRLRARTPRPMLPPPTPLQ